MVVGMGGVCLEAFMYDAGSGFVLLAGGYGFEFGMDGVRYKVYVLKGRCFCLYGTWF